MARFSPRFKNSGSRGLSLRQIAEALAAKDVAPPRSGWSHRAVQRILERAEEGFEEVSAPRVCPEPDCGAQMIVRRLAGSDFIRAICPVCNEGQIIATP